MGIRQQTFLAYDDFVKMTCASDTPFNYLHSSLKHLEDDYVRFIKNEGSIKYIPNEILVNTFTLIDDVTNHLEHLRNVVNQELRRRNGAIDNEENCQ